VKKDKTTKRCGMKILVINSGSSSIKYRLFDTMLVGFYFLPDRYRKRCGIFYFLKYKQAEVLCV